MAQQSQEGVLIETNPNTIRRALIAEGAYSLLKREGANEVILAASLTLDYARVMGDETHY